MSVDIRLPLRTLPIARELKLRGHEAVFCHAAKGPKIVIAEEGFQNLQPDDPLYYLRASIKNTGDLYVGNLTIGLA